MPRLTAPRVAPKIAARPAAEKAFKLVAGKTDQKLVHPRHEPLTLQLPPGKWQAIHSFWGGDLRVLDAGGARRQLSDRELSGSLRVVLQGDADVLLLRNVKTGQRASVHLAEPGFGAAPKGWAPGARARLPPIVPNRAGEEWE